MSTATLPPAAAAANAKTLDEAMASVKINGDELEEGEIQEDDESVRTVFDDAKKFNVKVSPTLDATDSSTPCTLNGPSFSTRPTPRICQRHRPLHPTAPLRTADGWMTSARSRR